MSEGPTRLTVRGGRDQFDWNNVKDDKHYQNYLGHSLKAPVGRWQHNKDLEWFIKAGETEDAKESARKEEMRLLKEAEEDAIATAMGITLPPREERAMGPSQVNKSSPGDDDLDDDKKLERSSRRRSKSPRLTSRSRSREPCRRRRERDHVSHRSSYRDSDRSHRTRSRSRDHYSSRHHSPHNAVRRRDHERSNTMDRPRRHHHTSDRGQRERRDRLDDK